VNDEGSHQEGASEVFAQFFSAAMLRHVDVDQRELVEHQVLSFPAHAERFARAVEEVDVAPATVTLFRGGETHRRSILKAISWRTLGTFDTFAISWFLTGKVAMAGSIAALEVITKVAWYYFHERVWEAVAWGRR
jgi:uncharacterized membrane protein